MSGIQRRTECEDWVEIREAGAFACVGRGAYETLLNFGGPGAAVDYHFYGRFDKGAEPVVQGIEVEGLEFVRVWQPLVVPGTPPGVSWVHFGSVKTGRSYRWNAPDGALEILPNLPDTLLPFEGPLFTPAFWAWLSVGASKRGMRLKIIKTFKSGILLKRLRISRSGALVVSVDGARVRTSPLAGGWHACRLDLSKLTVLEMKKGVHDPACTLQRGTGVPPVSKVNGRWQERRDGQDA